MYSSSWTFCPVLISVGVEILASLTDGGRTSGAEGTVTSSGSGSSGYDSPLALPPAFPFPSPLSSCLTRQFSPLEILFSAAAAADILGSVTTRIVEDERSIAGGPPWLDRKDEGPMPTIVDDRVRALSGRAELGGAISELGQGDTWRAAHDEPSWTMYGLSDQLEGASHGQQRFNGLK